MRQQITVFFFRWVANSISLAIAVWLNLISINGQTMALLLAAILLAVLNALLKPLLIIISLPLIAITLGFFLIIVNGIVIYTLSFVYPPLEITNFINAMVAGIIVGLVNYIVTITYERLTDS